jgi:hypothetical protein
MKTNPESCQRFPAAIRASSCRTRQHLDCRLDALQGLSDALQLGPKSDGRLALKSLLRPQRSQFAGKSDPRPTAFMRDVTAGSGVSPRVVMETLGRSRVSLRLNTYSHVLPALQEDAASRMN